MYLTKLEVVCHKDIDEEQIVLKSTLFTTERQKEFTTANVMTTPILVFSHINWVWQKS